MNPILVAICGDGDGGGGGDGGNVEMNIAFVKKNLECCNLMGFW